MLHDPAFERIETMLRTLRPSSGVDAKLAALRGAVEYWHGPIEPWNGIPAEAMAGLLLPRPLRWWHGWAGRREEIMSGQNILHAPGEARYPGRRLTMEDGLLLFHSENQYCYRWGTEPDGDDPPVFGREGDLDPWRPEGVTLSEHLVLTCLFEGIVGHSEFNAFASWLDETKFHAIRRKLPPLAIGPWRWFGTAFHCGSGAFMFAHPMVEHEGRHGHCVWLGARRREALAFLHPLIDDEWDAVNL